MPRTRALSTKQGPWRASHATSSAGDNPEEATTPESTSGGDGLPYGGTTDVWGQVFPLWSAALSTVGRPAASLVSSKPQP